MSGHLPIHQFVPHWESDEYCGHPAPDFNGGCVRPPDHPIHAVDRPDIEALALALSLRQWRTEPEGLSRGSEHAGHGYYYGCALCKQDVHAIAAFVIDHLNGDR